MIAILNQHIDKYGHKKSILYAAIISFSSDILLMLYIGKYMLPTMLNEKLIGQVLVTQGIDPTGISPSYLLELKNIMLQSGYTILGIILIYNFIIYCFMIKQKAWALTYIKAYVLSGAVLSIFEFIAPFFSSYSPNIITFITFLVYIFVFLTLVHIKRNPEQ